MASAPMWTSELSSGCNPREHWVPPGFSYGSGTQLAHGSQGTLKPGTSRVTSEGKCCLWVKTRLGHVCYGGKTF